MILHFDQELVRQMLAHSQTTPTRRVAFGHGKPAGPGLWLVGDRGVYLMNYRLPGQFRNPGSTRHLVCHAIEAEPDALSYDRADDAQRTSSGGDDRVEFIAAADLLNALADYTATETFAPDVTEERIGILLSARPKRKAGTQ